VKDSQTAEFLLFGGRLFFKGGAGEAKRICNAIVFAYRILNFVNISEEKK
jgi:hypothetical protein